MCIYPIFNLPLYKYFHNMSKHLFNVYCQLLILKVINCIMAGNFSRNKSVILSMYGITPIK